MQFGTRSSRPSRPTRRLAVAAAALAAVLTAFACGGTTSTGTGATPNQATKAAVNVGIVYSKTGLLASYGQQYIDGFQIGLDYATKGTSIVNGHKINWTATDDAGDAAKAVSAAKDLIGQGDHIIMGSTASGVALQVAPIAAQNKVLFISGPAASDAITGVNRYTFRSGRQSQQDVLAIKGTLTGSLSGKHILVFAQDTAFGQGNVAAVKALIGDPNSATVDKILVPATANDFTPFAIQAKTAKPDVMYIAWAGNTATAMYTALQQQGVLSSTTVVTGLDQTSTYALYGPLANSAELLSHYVSIAPKNAANDYLVAQLKKQGKVADIFSPDGFVGALMLVQAVNKADGDTNVDKMISALEGYSFTGPKGAEQIRAQDHATLQPMFIVKLTGSGTTFTPEVVKTVSMQDATPPAVPMKS
jgi:branched-chain amino acid transport system substrate-binding protein